MANPAREKYRELLSAYVDGELTPAERQEVEQHLQNNKLSAGDVADFRAAGGLLRHHLDAQADDVDWKAFSDNVMAKVSKQPLPFFERLKLSFSERLQYQRGPLVAGFVGAALAIAVTVPVVMRLSAATPDGYAGTTLQVQTVSAVENTEATPVVTQTDEGDAVIWAVEKPANASDDAGKKKKKKTEEGEEELLDNNAPNKEGPL